MKPRAAVLLSAVLAVLAAPLAAQIAPQWLETSSQPRLRVGSAMANDPLRGHALLFSGHALSNYLGNLAFTADLWEWSGRAWVQRAAVGPSARRLHAMATDFVRSRVVLFGGETSFGQRLNDTWEYDGRSWLRRTPATSPPASSEHALAYDPLRRRTVAFGGPLQTWEWDGNNWAQALPPLEPPLRWNGAMVFDATLGETLLFGGMVPGRAPLFLADTWSFDGARWLQRGSAGPPGRYLHAMTFDFTRARTLLFGGTDGNTTFTDTWEFTAGAWLQRTPATTPGASWGPSLAWDPVRGGPVLVTAEPRGNGAPAPATWTWNGSDWAREPLPPSPPERIFHAFAPDPQPGHMLAFGGYADPTSAIILGDTWRWDGARWQEVAIGAGPPARHSFGLALDSARARLVLFGGAGTAAVFNDTWEWNGNAWTQRAPAAAPPPRFRHALAFDAARNRIVLFGGTDNFQLFGDTWTWDGNAWQLAASTGPDARTEPTMVFDSSRSEVLLFGGVSNTASPERNDLWRWNGSAWTQVPTPAVAPARRWYHAMAFDPLRNRAIVHGGLVLNVHGNTWEWDGNAWTQTWTAAPVDFMPLSVCNGTMAWDAARGRVLLYDGLDLWTYATAPAAASTYGTGCGGATGPPRLEAAGRPFLGNGAFHLELSATAPGLPAGVFLALAQAAAPLPGGCTLLLGAPVPWSFALTSTIEDGVLLPLPLSASPAALGLSLFAQAALLDPAAPLGLALSNGVRLSLGE